MFVSWLYFLKKSSKQANTLLNLKGVATEKVLEIKICAIKNSLIEMKKLPVLWSLYIIFIIIYIKKNICVHQTNSVMEILCKNKR